MLSRFVSAAAVASVLVALAVAVIGLSPVLSFAKVYPMPIAWCVLPLVWGIWAAILPQRWARPGLPLWGGTLGLMAGVLALVVLNLPSVVFQIAVPLTFRLLGVLVLTLLYYFFWVLVELVHETLEKHSDLPTAKLI